MEAKLNVLLEVIQGLDIDIFKAPVMTLADFTARKANLVVVDIRTPEESAVSTIEGAVLREAFERSFETLYKGKEIVVFDTVGYLSAAYAAALIKKGNSNISYLAEGGYLGYILHGGVIVKPDGTSTSDVHTYNEQLSLLVNDTMNAVYFEDAETRLYEAIAFYSNVLDVKIEV